MKYFFSCDWGTTSFRLRLATLPAGEVIQEITSADGVKAILNQLPRGADAAEREAVFSRILQEHLAQLRERAGLGDKDAPVMISGMASSSVGWRELPYASLPFPVDGSGARLERVRLSGSTDEELAVWLVSGVATDNDMMRGEETELIGLMSRGEGYSARSVVILPGTHSKHIWIRDAAVVDLRTYLTGELFAVLCEHSLLRVSVADDAPEGRAPAADESAFCAGVDTVRRDGLAGSLFKVRARAVLDRSPSGANRSFLSGLLIGAELMDCTRGETQIPILLAATGTVARSYYLAGRQLGLADRITMVDEPLIKRAAVLGQAQLLQRLGVEALP